MNLLIPAATLIPEQLQNIGKLPAIIYPIHDGIVFDYLLNQYNEEVDSIHIICYEKADKVQRRLSTYNNEKINITILPTLKDLGHTIYNGLNHISGPVIINFSDTIVEENIASLENDCFFYSEALISQLWTFFDEKNGVITNVYDKLMITSQETKKLFVGVFKLMDSVLFYQCLYKAFEQKDRSISTFYIALQLYSQIRPLRPIYTNNWFDIGHADRYFNSKIEVQAREFNDITIDRNRGILKKTSKNKEKFIGEILWYLKLPTDIEYARPRIFSYSTSFEYPFIEMEYYSYHTIHELFLYGDLTSSQWQDVFKRIRFICNDFRRYNVKGNGIKESLEEMYLNKSLLRLEQLKQNSLFENFFTKEIVINQTKYLSLNDICLLLQKIIPEMLYDVTTFNIIHGDLCFTNILIDNNFHFIKMIDPRGKFGLFDIYGDVRYELAKIFHSIDGKYDFIIKNLFFLECYPDKNIINYSILDRKRDYNLIHIFLSVFSEEINSQQSKIELIEALLFFSMIPLHNENKRHQYAMLATGIEILSRIINIKV